MKKFEVILTNQIIGVYIGKTRPVEGQTVKVYVGDGVFISGIVYDVL